MDLLIGFPTYSHWISVDSSSQSKSNMNKMTLLGRYVGIPPKETRVHEKSFTTLGYAPFPFGKYNKNL